VYLKEDYSNDWAPEQNEEILTKPYITGSSQVYSYDIIEYEIHNAINGIWTIEGNSAKIIDIKDNLVTVEVTSGRRGEFRLVYELDGSKDIYYDVSILSL
jgi:hypothetical protein